MIKGIGTGISIASTTPPEQKTTVQEQPQLPVASPGPTTTPNVTQMKSDLQMTGFLQQATLLNRLNRAPLTPGNAQKEAKAQAEISYREARLNQQDHLQDPNVSLFAETRKKLLADASAPLMKTLQTGSGDDLVDISMGDDYRVHVTVNGKEAWAGTDQEFQKLIIDTGDGNDIVTINVNGAKVTTGGGDDQVLVAGWQNYVETGAGNDEVVVADVGTYGDNQIFTGDGSDTVRVNGDRNSIYTEGGDDAVIVNAQHNNISTGSGDDYVELRDPFGANRVRTGDGDDVVNGRGMFDAIDGKGPFGPTKD